MQEAKVHRLHLTHLYRQSDPKFGAMLSRIRTASHTKMDLAWINERVQKIPPNGSTVLSLKKLPAVKINADMLNRIGGEIITLTCDRTGTYKDKTYDKKGFKNSGSYADEIHLKVGCKVIVKKNGKCKVDGYEVEYTNGDSGVFCGIDKHDKLIIERKDGEIIYVKRETEGDVDQKVVEETEIQVDNDGNEHKVKIKKLVDVSKGTFKQYPITLGYAQTGHSSQGLTLERVHIVLPDGIPFAPNYIYVVMSRVRDPNKLTFNRPLTMQCIWCIDGLRNNANQQSDLEI